MFHLLIEKDFESKGRRKRKTKRKRERETMIFVEYTNLRLNILSRFKIDFLM